MLTQAEMEVEVGIFNAYARADIKYERMWMRWT